MSQSNSNSPTVAKRSSLFAHPIGFWFFFWGEFAERCCYYGMVTILVLFMTQILRFEDSQAARIFNYYLTACYLLPLVGGYIADRYLGKYRTIVYFAIPYIIGQSILGIASLHNAVFLYLSLALLAMGSGVIKPNISTLMGMTYDQLRPGQTKLRSDAFAMFYGAINVGSALSSLAVPAIRNYFGSDSRAYAIAFLFPAALMVFSFLVFVIGKPFYAKETTAWTPPTPQQRRERWVILRRLLGLFLVVTVFWSIFNQSASTWIFFARDYLRLELFGMAISPDQLMVFNPVLIIVLLPLVTMFWHLLARLGWDLKPTSKMTIGFVLTTATAIMVTLAAFRGSSVVVANAPSALMSAESTQYLLTPPADLPNSPTGKANAAARVVGRTSLAAARLAWQTVSSATWNADAIKQLRTTGESTALAIAECDKAVRLAEKAASGQENENQVDLTECTKTSVAANKVVAFVRRTADALAADNRSAARLQAAMAVAAANETTLVAAKLAARATNVEVSSLVVAAEQSILAGRISLFWQIIPYIVVTIAEICISVVGLELAFAAAPATMKSFVTACWLLTISVGNILNAETTPWYNETVFGLSFTPNWYFLAFALLMIPVTLTFILIARRFDRPAT